MLMEALKGLVVASAVGSLLGPGAVLGDDGAKEPRVAAVEQMPCKVDEHPGEATGAHAARPEPKPTGSKSAASAAEHRTTGVKMMVPDPSDPFVRSVWESP